MNLNNFTIKAQEAVQKAQQLAFSNNHQHIENAHILKALLEVDENVVGYLFKKLNVNTNVLTTKVDEQIAKLPKISGGEGGQFLSQGANKTMMKAQDFMKEFKDDFVSVEHLVLALLAGNDSMALGAVAAVKAAGKTGKVQVVGYDNIGAIKPMLADGRVLATADQFAAKQAVFGIELAQKALAAKTPQAQLPAAVKTDVVLVTKDSK